MVGRHPARALKAPQPQLFESVPVAQASDSIGITAKGAKRIVLQNFRVKDTGHGRYEVLGEATNNDDIEHLVMFRITFYDAANDILGSGTGTISDLGAGETKVFSVAIYDNIGGYAAMKVQIDHVFDR